jgi:hypothetical protein
MDKLIKGFFVEEASSLFIPSRHQNAAGCRVYEDGPLTRAPLVIQEETGDEQDNG